MSVIEAAGNKRFCCHHARDPGPNKRGWVDFFEGVRQALTTILDNPQEIDFFQHISLISVTFQCYNAMPFGTVPDSQTVVSHGSVVLWFI